MRVRYLAAQHLRSARCPLHRYFVRKFRFPAELMVSYFNLMIASDLCFATTPVDAWHEHDLMALGLWPSAHGPPTWTGGQGSIRRNKAHQAAAPRDEVAHPCRPPFQGVRDESALATALRYRDDGPSAIQLSRRDVGPLSVES